jgi:lipid II:glycine glycyltransferase (peptidoglycan interpeptide bridge formation enzyme)
MATKEAAELAVELAAEFSSLDQPSEDPEILFDALYEEVPTETARIVSRMDREKNNFKAPALTYGEITFSAFKEMFDRLYVQGLPNSGGCFIDLGCGSGRPV